jgi:hypothetical protein
MHRALYLLALLLYGVASAQDLVPRQPASPVAPKPAAVPTGWPPSVGGYHQLAIPRATAVPVFFDQEMRNFFCTRVGLSNDWSVVVGMKCPLGGGDASCFAKRS